MEIPADLSQLAALANAIVNALTVSRLAAMPPAPRRAVPVPS